MREKISTLFLLLCLTISAQQLVVYKEIDTIQLFLEIRYPEHIDEGNTYPGMIFFFGGGWIEGNRSHFIHQANYFSKRGMVCVLADYRIERNHQSTPFESLMDAKSAVRFMKKNARKFCIDSTKIIAVGGSAGGHLAAATALIQSYNDVSDDLSISSVPDALVLFNPVIDNGPGGYGYSRIGEAYKDFSPLHNLKAGVPPTIIFLGTSDNLIPVETAKYYQRIMQKLGSRCDLKLYENQPHGFFNHAHFEYYKKTLSSADLFLQSLGYLSEEPSVKIE